MKNTFWNIPITLIVAAQNKQEAKRILWAQLEEMEGENIDIASEGRADYCGILGYTAGALKPVPNPKFEKEFRETWGDDNERADEQFTTRSGDGLAEDERRVAEWQDKPSQESVYKHTGKQKNKR